MQNNNKSTSKKAEILSDMQLDKAYNTRLRRIHVDFHNSPFIDNAFSRFDAENFVMEAKESFCDVLTIFAKDHYGYSYYKTNIGVAYPQMSGDFLGEIVDSCKKADIAVIGYYSLAWDNLACGNHFKWAARNVRGELVINGGWHWCCLNTGYRDYALDSILEIAENYTVDGLWLDWDERKGGTYPCYCDQCRNLYKQTYGYAMQDFESSGNSQKIDLIHFWTQAKIRFIDDLHFRLLQIGKPLPIVLNNSGAPYHAFEESEFMGLLSIEAHAPDFATMSIKSKYHRSLSKNSEILVSRFSEGWGSWTIKNNNTVKTEVALILANGCLPTVGDQIYPEGHHEIEAYKGLKLLFNEIKSREPWLKGYDPVAKIGILNSYGSNLVSHLQDGLNTTGNVYNCNLSLFGTCKALNDLYIQYEMFNEKQLEKIINYEVIILPNQLHISLELNIKLKEFTEQGGKIITFGKTGLYDQQGGKLTNFAMHEWLDIKHEGEMSDLHLFYRLSDDVMAQSIPAMPILFDSAIQQISVGSAVDVLGCLIEKVPFVYERYASPGDTIGSPMVASQRVKEGEVVYISGDLGKDYWVRNDIWTKQLLANSLAKLNYVPSIEVRKGFHSDVTLHQGSEGKVVHLVTGLMHISEGGKSYIDDKPFTQEVEFLYRNSEHVKEVRCLPSLEKCNWRRTDEGIIVNMSVSEIHCMVLMEE